MHIPDGFLDAKTAIATAVLSVAGASIALRHARIHMPRHQVPLLGLTAAFIFAAQMINFPVAGGTSGHLMGAVLASVLLGPAPAMIAMTAVVIVQCLLFADGGLLALGANLFNMAVVGPVVGFTLFEAIRRSIPGRRGMLLAAGFASWATIVIAAILCAGELAWSGTVPWQAGFPAMANVHMLIGLGEGAITMLALSTVARARPDLLERVQVPGASRPVGTAVSLGIVVTIGLLLFVSPFASPWPDGLESTARALGFDRNAVSTPVVHAPFFEYQIPGIHSAAIATMLAGVVGAVLVFGLAFAFARVLAPGKDMATPDLHETPHAP